MVQANWDSVDSDVPPGKYIAEVKQAVEKASKQGYPMAEIEFVIDEGQYKGQSIRDWISLKAKVLWRFKKLGTCAGMEMKGDADIPVSDLNGKKVGIVVNEREVGDQIRSSVAGYFKIGDVSDTELEDVPF